MSRSFSILILCFFHLYLVPNSEAQQKILFSIGGPTIQTMVVTQADFDKFGRVQQQSVDSEGREVTYKGVALSDLLFRAGVPVGQELRKEKLLYYLIVRGKDGYEALFSLPEIDPSFSDQIMMLCMSDTNGIPQINLIVPNDKKRSRWVKHIVALQLGQIAPKVPR